MTHVDTGFRLIRRQRHYRIASTLSGILAITTLLLHANAALAAVERIEIIEDHPFASSHVFADAGEYQKIRAIAHFAVDPLQAKNRVIIDIDKAPRDADGLVRFESEFVLLRPTHPHNPSTLIYDVNNRGGIAIMGQVNGQSPLNNDPNSLSDAGDGFLFRHGYSLLFSAWTFDVAPQPPPQKPLVFKPPVAWGPDHTPIQGDIENEFIVASATAITSYAGQRGLTYEPLSLDDPKAVLSEKDAPNSQRRIIDRSRWHFLESEQPGGPGRIALDSGFNINRIYTLHYKTQNPYVSGLGLVGIRDLLDYFKTMSFQGQSAYTHSIIFGISQSARVIGRMLHDGLDVSEHGQLVFDGAYLEVPGGGGSGGFNYRFAQPTRHPSMLEEHDYPTDTFPFSFSTTTDPLTHQSASRLDNAYDEQGHLPKIMVANTSTEYWNRDASLVTTTVDGQRTVPIPDNVRIYAFLGAQHYVGRATERYPYTACVSTTDHYLPMRALIEALNHWVVFQTRPPNSQFPQVENGTLVSAEYYRKRWPAVPELTPPDSPLTAARLDFGPTFAQTGVAEYTPPRHGPPYVSLVPKPDKDGNDMGGIPMLEISVPLGTHTGWNKRDSRTGFGWATARFDGSFVPFARTRAERMATHDPRPSIEERYPTRERYIKQLNQAADHLIANGYLLPEDRERTIRENVGLYDRLLRREEPNTSCHYLFNDNGKL